MAGMSRLFLKLVSVQQNKCAGLFHMGAFRLKRLVNLSIFASRIEYDPFSSETLQLLKQTSGNGMIYVHGESMDVFGRSITES